MVGGIRRQMRHMIQQPWPLLHAEFVRSHACSSAEVQIGSPRRGQLPAMDSMHHHMSARALSIHHPWSSLVNPWNGIVLKGVVRAREAPAEAFIRSPTAAKFGWVRSAADAAQGYARLLRTMLE